MLLVVGGLGETFAVVMAAIFGLSAFSQGDAAERSRLWTSAGWWMFGSLVFTALSVVSLVRLLRVIAWQAPGAAPDQNSP